MADPVVADYYLGATPAYPAALDGVHAPTMLGFLPPYYDESIHVREILQVEGYEIDFMWYLAQEVIPTLTRPEDCPEWALAMWEAVLKIPGRSTWAAADRRASIAARIGQVVTETELKNFLAAEARVDPADITFDIRSTAFEPEDITGVVEVWVADDIALADATAVASWVGRVSAANLAQATGGKQPLYRTAGLGGQPAVDFDGADDLLRYGGQLSTALSGSVFIVCRLDSDAAAGTVFASSDEGTATSYIYGAVSASPAKMALTQRNANDATDGTDADDTLAINTDYLLEFASSGTAWELRRNDDVQALTVNSGVDTGDWFGDTTLRDNFTIGGMKRTSEVQFLNGKIAAVVVVDGGISIGDRGLLVNWINNKYGTTIPFSGTNHHIDIQTAGMTAGEEEAIRAASRLAFAAHLGLYLNGVAFTP